MTTRTAWVAFDHKIDYQKRGSRKILTANVQATMPVEIAEACPREVRRVGSATLAMGAGAVEYHVYKGGLVRTATGQDGRILGFADLAPERSAVIGDPWRAWEYPFQVWARTSVAPEQLGIGQILASEREAEEARVRAIAERMCLVDGVLMVPVAAPVWMLTKTEWATGIVEFKVNAVSRAQAERQPHVAVFPAARLEDAQDHAEFLAHRHPIGWNGVLNVHGAIVVEDPSAFALADLEDLEQVALGFFDAVEQRNLGFRFQDLSDEGLTAWMAFRRHARAFRAGDRQSLHEAYEALEALLAQAPGLEMGAEDRVRTDLPSYLLRDVLAGPLHRYREIDLPRMAPMEADEDDAVALGGIVPGL